MRQRNRRVAGATATATVSSGVVTAVNITNVGSGYTSLPTVAIYHALGTGSGATAAVNGITLTGLLLNEARLRFLVNAEGRRETSLPFYELKPVLVARSPV